MKNNENSNIIKIKKLNGFTYNFIILCLSTIFLIITMYVGSFLENNVQVINLFINVIAIVGILYSFINGRSLKVNKLDISVFVICFSFFIPIIFKSYISINDTIDYLMWYMSVFNIYTLIRIFGNEKFINLISNIIIINSVLLILFGIDDMTFRLLLPIREKLGGIVEINSSKSLRLDSLFEYPNSFAICIGMGFILTLSKYLKSEKLMNKICINSILFLQICAIILSGSRLCLIVFGFLVFFIFALKKDDKSLIRVILLTLYDFLFGLIFSNRYLATLEAKNYINTYIYLVVFLILNEVWYLVIYYLLKKIINSLNKTCIIEKNLKRKNIIFLIAITFLIVIFGLVFIIFKEAPIEVSSDGYGEQKLAIRTISNVSANTQYTFTFDISSYSEVENYKFYIHIKEYDKDEKNISDYKELLKSPNGKREIKITTKENVNTIRIEFVNNNKGFYSKLLINSLEINEKHYKINYKYLPVNLVNRFTRQLSTTKSTWLRFYYVKDGLKLAMKNLFFRTRWKWLVLWL